MLQVYINHLETISKNDNYLYMIKSFVNSYINHSKNDKNYI